MGSPTHVKVVKCFLDVDCCKNNNEGKLTWLCKWPHHFSKIACQTLQKGQQRNKKKDIEDQSLQELVFWL